MKILLDTHVVVWWLAFTEAGRLVFGAATDNKNDPHKLPDQAILDLPNWFTNVFRDNTDEYVLIALVLLVLAALGLSARASAAELGVAPATVLAHLANIYERLRVTQKTTATTLTMDDCPLPRT